MSVMEQLMEKSRISRRGFLKGVGAAGATASLYGCGGGDGGSSLLEETPQLTPPKITESIVSGSAPHNCGGRCIIRVFVKDGAIKRMVTDETPDLDYGKGDLPQMRACIRCRANKQRFYRKDRILYPLKQTKTRGDVTGFVRISWDQAATEIATQLKGIITKYTADSLHVHYASADGNEATNSASCCSRLFNLLGGQMSYRNDYSWPSMEHTSWFTFGGGHYFPPGKSRQDAFNSDVLFLWSGNFAESIWGTNTMWYLQQLKEKGVRVIVLDNRLSQTAITQASEYVSVAVGTDAALIQAMFYEMITKTWDKDGNKVGNLLDEQMILKYVHGFFDDKAFDKYPAISKAYTNVDRTRYAVKPGSSMSAYIMGTDDRLVKAGLNGATSVYPDSIGYNNYNIDDPISKKLKDALVPCYGQVAKTPEWAEPICGVPAAKIRELAQTAATKKCSFWLGGGFQRQSEGEQGPLHVYALGAVTGNFGLPGRHVGTHSDRQPISFGLAFPAGSNPAAGNYPELYDWSKLTPGVQNLNPIVYLTATTFPVFLWPDIAKNGGTGKSMWNDGQVKKIHTKIKADFNFAGNCLVNQCGNYNEAAKIIKDKNNIELIVTSDQFMTPSASFSDYILPPATAFEKQGACTGWLAGDCITSMNKAVEPLGEAKSDYDIVTLLADKLGVKDKFTEGKTADDWIKQQVDPLLKAYNAGMTYEQWKEKGFFHMDEKYGTYDSLAQFRSDPTKSFLQTPTGKIELYAQLMVEDYEARWYVNDDARTTLKGALHDGKTTGKFVYPIPMMIPMLEGQYADGSHPGDAQGIAGDYPYCLNGWHIFYRSHSTHNNTAYMNEVFKKDQHGNPAFMDPERAVGAVWDDQVYEPIWINPVDAQKEGIVTGDRVIVSSPRGSIYASAVVTNRTRPNWMGIGQGAWANGDNANGKPDIGGAINVLTKMHPARICQGMTLGADTRINIKKG